MDRPLAALGILFAFLSGCAASPGQATLGPGPAGAAQESAAAGASGPSPAFETRTERTPFGWQAGVGASAAENDLQIETSNGASMEVPENATRLALFANWTCASPGCTLVIRLYQGQEPAPSFPGQPAATLSGTGTNAVRLEAKDPKPGHWWATAHAQSPSAQVEGSFVFQATAPPGRAPPPETS